MQGVKPWQIVVLVLGLVGGGFGIWYGLRGDEQVELASSVILVDVSTGELFEVPLNSGKAVIPPVKNPKTGIESLFPADSDGAGGWRLNERFLSYIDRLSKAKPDAVVDRKTGQLKITGDGKTRIDNPS